MAGEAMLTKNDRRVLDAVKQACEEFDGFAPHGSRDWTALRRLAAQGLVDDIGIGWCEMCADEGGEHEGPVYVLTEAGRTEFKRLDEVSDGR